MDCCSSALSIAAGIRLLEPKIAYLWLKQLVVQASMLLAVADIRLLEPKLALCKVGLSTSSRPAGIKKALWLCVPGPSIQVV